MEIEKSPTPNQGIEDFIALIYIIWHLSSRVLHCTAILLL